MTGIVTLTEGATPATPAAGFMTVFPNVSNQMSSVDPSGNVGWPVAPAVLAAHAVQAIQAQTFKNCLVNPSFQVNQVQKPTRASAGTAINLQNVPATAATPATGMVIDGWYAFDATATTHG